MYLGRKKQVILNQKNQNGNEKIKNTNYDSMNTYDQQIPGNKSNICKHKTNQKKNQNGNEKKIKNTNYAYMTIANNSKQLLTVQFHTSTLWNIQQNFFNLMKLRVNIFYNFFTITRDPPLHLELAGGGGGLGLVVQCFRPYFLHLDLKWYRKNRDKHILVHVQQEV